MRLSTIASAVNTLCQEQVEWPQFDPWAIPDLAGHQKLLDETRKAVDDFCRIRGPIQCGIDMGKGDSIGSWWGWEPGMTMMRTWFEENTLQFRSEQITDFRSTSATSAAASSEREFTAMDILRAAEALKDLPPPPAPLRLSRWDYIRLTAKMDVYHPGDRHAGLNTFSGVPLEVVPDDDPRRWIPGTPIPLNPGN